MRKYYIAVNHYRSSTSDGFPNTWEIRRVTRTEQIDILKNGLPVNDCWYDDGTRVCSTMGIRLASRAERRWAKSRGY